jgi:hypothetical protein
MSKIQSLVAKKKKKKKKGMGVGSETHMGRKYYPGLQIHQGSCSRMA